MKELPDLQKLVKEIWSQSYKWRLGENGYVEFALETCDGDQWFPYWRSPKKVEKFVQDWLIMGGV